MTGDRVGTTSGFLKMPHTYPRTDAEHAANTRHLENIVNNIPAGSPPKVYYSDTDLTLPGAGTAVETDVEFRIPAGLTTFEGLVIAQVSGTTFTGYELSTVDAIAGTVRGSLGGTPTGLGTDTLFAQFRILIVHDFPQSIEFQIGATTDSGAASTAEWQFTVTSVVAG